MTDAPTFLLDFELQRGTFRRSVDIRSDQRVIALVGESGAGKTSVLQAIAGLVRPRRGRIEIGGHCLFDAAHGIDVPTHRLFVTLLSPHVNGRQEG